MIGVLKIFRQFESGGSVSEANATLETPGNIDGI